MKKQLFPFTGSTAHPWRVYALLTMQEKIFQTGKLQESL